MGNRESGAWRVFHMLVGCLVLAAPHSLAQRVAAAGAAPVPVLMVSDIHFEPFWDPAKVPQLAAAPAPQWNAILAAGVSPDQQQRFAALQRGCKTKDVDTSYPLFVSSLRAIQKDSTDVKFITLSGDIISHNFTCKFAAVFPHAAAGDYKAFVEKTVDFVLSQLRASLPSVPLYAALGNNDSDCEDYRLDTHGDLLSTEGRTFAADFSISERSHVQKTFAVGGYYSAPLPAPFQHARLIAIDDIFMSTKYETCAGKPDPAAAAAQIAWLRDRLSMARRNKEKVWVMGHIPPGVDPYSTATKFVDVCGGQPALTFLSSGALAQTLSEFGDVVQLAIFAHTHMDELRLIPPAKNGSPLGSVALKPIPLKMVPSISPVDGNNPAFTVALVNPNTMVMTDYRVFVSSDAQGTSWSPEYDYQEAYHQPSFSSSSVQNLIAGFVDDPKAQSSSSQAYLNNYFPGSGHPELKTFWEPYVCALSNLTPDSYKKCVCVTTPATH